jgi:hypothetical protein
MTPEALISVLSAAFAAAMSVGGDAGMAVFLEPASLGRRLASTAAGIPADQRSPKGAGDDISPIVRR